MIVVSQLAFETAAQLARVGTGLMLLVMTFYLQFFADSSCSSTRLSIPAHFRWPPFVLAVLLLDRARADPFIPFNDYVIAIVVYVAFCYMVWHGFWIVLNVYSEWEPAVEYDPIRMDERGEGER